MTMQQPSLKTKKERCENYKLKDYILIKNKYIELYLKISYTLIGDFF